MLNEVTTRALKPVNPISIASSSNISKGSESKFDSDNELADSKTLEALEMLKDDEFLNQF